MLDVASIRRQFPALERLIDGQAPVFFDGPGGTQVPRRVIDAMVHYLSTCNANHGGLFATSRESDAILQSAHEAVADLINAPAAEEIVFGANMTSLTLHLSRAVGRVLKPGDEVIVSRLDHDANVTSWAVAAREAGAAVHFLNIHPEDCTLDLEQLRRLLNPRTRLVAVAAASNAVGTVNDVATIARWAHAVGAWVFVDAVHYAPHGPIDVQAWGCDFLACSAYKFFGPHVGVLWGRRELLESLPAYKLRPVPDRLPDRWMTGTQNHEGLAGLSAAIDYLAELGADELPPSGDLAGTSGRRRRLRTALADIRAYEAGLARQLLQALADRPRFRVWGITDLGRLDQRVPTISLTHPDLPPDVLARHLARRNIQVWHGNLYAVELTHRLGLEERGGFLRIGLVHYNTAGEIDRLLQALDELDHRTSSATRP
jgi:cysteine desulfurase family protein (TIGR01976 family)